MSNANVMNISTSNIDGECDLKCSYYFNYSNSSCVVFNAGTCLYFKYDQSVTAPVVYNENNYQVADVLLLVPSIHQFNNNRADAELIIYHYPVSTGNVLAVCIPIKRYMSSNSLMDSLIVSAAGGVPTKGMTATLPISNFNLKNLVPKDAFFSYTTSQNIDFIVFGATSAIPIRDVAFNKLIEIVKQDPSVYVPKGPKVFYNKKGPSLTSGNFVSNDIYIDCQPTNASEEQVVLKKDSPSGLPATQYDLFHNSGMSSVLQIFLLSLIIFVILFGCYYLFKSIKTRTHAGVQQRR